MNRFFLTAWLVTPVLLFASFYILIPKKAARLDDKPAGIVKPVDAAKPAPPAKPGDGAKMVQPEFLPQGFVVVVEDLPKLATNDSPVFIAGSFNGWNPGDEKSVLSRRSDLKWQIIMPPSKNNAPYEFKFTRGSWDLEQLNEDLSVPGNTMLPKVDASKYPPGGERPVFEFKVVKWGDQRPDAAARPDLNPYYTLNVTGTVKRLQVGGGGVPGVRDLLVWLPPGYVPGDEGYRYPVLYMQDGQNLFMQMPGTQAEWDLDATATRLIMDREINPVIIVGIPHMGKGRLSEYLPLPWIDGVEPRGDQYLNWLVDVVVPRVDRAFRTKADPMNRAIGGSSMGALISLYAGVKRPDIFGSVVAMSPSVMLKDDAPVLWLAEQKSWPSGYVYLSFGDSEAGEGPARAAANNKIIESNLRLANVVKHKKEVEKFSFSYSLYEKPVPNSGHNELAWQKQSERMLFMLYHTDEAWQRRVKGK